MEKQLQELVEISNFYGRAGEYVLGGGGNTSWKTSDHLHVKASGNELASIDASGFVILDRSKLKQITTKEYPADESLRDTMLTTDLLNCCSDPSKKLRPSVESTLHHLINYQFVVHTHPTIVNSLLCSNKLRENFSKLFGEEVLLIPYCNPGYVLFKTLQIEIEAYRKKYSYDPKIIMVQNHGIFVSSDSTEEIKKIYGEVLGKIGPAIKLKLPLKDLPVNPKTTQILPALRMILSENSVKLVHLMYNELVEYFTNSEEKVNAVSLPFTPDNIVYCRTRPLYIDCTESPDEILQKLKLGIENYSSKYGFNPKLILIKEIGMISIGDNSIIAATMCEVFLDLMKISYLSETFGGPHFMTESEISYIENWESEKYRENLSKVSGKGKLTNKIAIITGAAQGFGKGIAEEMMKEGANLVIADLNEAKGLEFTSELNKGKNKNKALFVKTDVTEETSVQNLILQTVKELGGLDVFVSNAGILHAGSLDEMKPETFTQVTRVNYEGYFLCVKYASQVMKLQSVYRNNYFTDIIQINSKSGLRGSKKNFAYSGGKFGGIGLTQSFALELIEYNIKVNSICPGNFYEGPLWSDPEKGLFLQYLKTGKVPGAKTIEDVRKFYEAQVPARRGCTVNDVMKAIYYVIDQEYETGQAIPVTGGQVMLN